MRGEFRVKQKRTVVVKLGGSLLHTLPDSFFRECVALRQAGVQVVIVHGGGPRINDYMKKLSLKAEFVGGLRVTDESVLELVEMVLGGSVNKNIVTRLEQAGGSAIGVSGIDRGFIQVREQDPALGFVGEIERVKVDVLLDLCSLGWIPVVASLGVDINGQHYNINADTTAGAVAKALEAEQLVMVTDVPGILHGEGSDARLIDQITPKQIEQLITAGTIHGGMIPKVRAAAASVIEGVKSVRIVDGNAPGVLTGVVGTNKGTLYGTKVVTEGSETDGVNRDVYALAD